MLDSRSEKLADSLTVGSAVRYNQTAYRWFIAVVRKIGLAEIEIQYLDGERESVPVEKVENLTSHLRNRERVLSLTREKLCEAFYRLPLTRLRGTRAEQMRRFLRSHGLRFQPEEWSASTRIQIWPDDSRVSSGISASDRAFEALLPRWLEPQRLPPGSRDPLGFQGSAERLANEFLPGLTVFTTRIAYYGLIAWAVRELNQQRWSSGPVRRELFHKIERAYVLCEFIYHGSETNGCQIIGQRSKSEVLQQAVQDRFRPPPRIMKNQDSAGSLRLYTTSLASMGFAELRPELAADGLLPLSLTELGNRLANEFAKQIPDRFIDFAVSDKFVRREVLREWGRTFCMSRFGKLKYRSLFLEGFLLGNSKAAEARFHTVSLLLARKLTSEDYRAKRFNGHETLPEEAANIAEEEVESGGLSNASVLLHFYEEAPSSEIALLQRAAVYELLSLAFSAIFKNAIDALGNSGRYKISRLLEAIVANKRFGKFWLSPFGQSGRLPAARELHDALFVADGSVEMAAAGGVLLRRMQQDMAFRANAPDLIGTPPSLLLEGVASEKPLADSFEGLMESMVTRHEHVSLNKNRQRWCYLDNNGRELVKDDLRPLGVGWHAMRFPQLFSLCRDLQLAMGDLDVS
ncbi:hypothetical protein [Bradyrhizobium sp. ARR65]|uniref:hypothetical protein n=1 Tax=Bradyrhizobium sp. ARR65 TaxID=1040989 RepID=UPI000685DE83|nr:hypothetical protein [Bradyrhizobium sp. ARR65]